jgi:hypothetical protein
MEKNVGINNKRKEYKMRQMKINSSFEKDENNNDNKKKIQNLNVINGIGANLDNKNKYQNGITSDQKSKQFLSKNSNTNYPFRAAKLSNNINSLSLMMEIIIIITKMGMATIHKGILNMSPKEIFTIGIIQRIILVIKWLIQILITI